MSSSFIVPQPPLFRSLSSVLAPSVGLTLLVWAGCMGLPGLAAAQDPDPVPTAVESADNTDLENDGDDGTSRPVDPGNDPDTSADTRPDSTGPVSTTTLPTGPEQDAESLPVAGEPPGMSESAPVTTDTAVTAEGVPDTASAPAQPPQGAEPLPILGESLIDDTPTDALDQIEQALKASEVTDAKAELTAYIEQVEDATHRYSPDLVRPLVLLGDVQMSEKDFTAAADTFGRAVHIDRVANGLHSASQAAIVYREADALVALGNIAAANDRELYAYEIQERQYDDTSLDLLPAAFRLADWQVKTGSILGARTLYEKAIYLLETNDALTGDRALKALRGAASTYRYERFPPLYQPVQTDLPEDDLGTGRISQPYGYDYTSTALVNAYPRGEKALQAAAVLVRQDPAATPQDKAGALTDLGDWYLLFDHSERATPLYMEARRLLEDAKLDADMRRFDQPEMLYFPEPPPLNPPAPDQRAEVQDGYVTVGFTVTENGEVHDLVTKATEPDDLMEFRVRRSMRVARFRPALVEGTLVSAADQSYTYDYRFFPKKQAGKPLESAAPKDADPAPAEAPTGPPDVDAPATTSIDSGDVTPSGDATR